MTHFFEIYLNIILLSKSDLLTSLFFARVCQPEACMQLFPPSYVPHAPPIVFIFVSVVFVCLRIIQFVIMLRLMNLCHKAIDPTCAGSLLKLSLSGIIQLLFVN